MASSNNFQATDHQAINPQPSSPRPGHQRTRSAVLKFIQRRQAPHGTAVSPTASPISPVSPIGSPLEGRYTNVMAMANSSKNSPGALGELQQNQQEPAPRSPRKSRDERRADEAAAGRSRSPTKSTFLGMAMARDASPTKKPKKMKSGTNLAGLLRRPKSLKNLHKLMTDEDLRSSKDKENRTPEGTLGAPLPIFAQFASDSSLNSAGTPSPTGSVGRDSTDRDIHVKAGKERPRSFLFPARSQQETKRFSSPKKPDSPNGGARVGSSDGKSIRQRTKAFNGIPTFGHGRSKSAASSPSLGSASSADWMPDFKDIDKQLEALLDRRNIPENQRYKMRNLNSTIKMEFIRQDWAEMQVAKMERPETKDGSVSSINGAVASVVVSDVEENKPKRSRGRSFTFSRGKKDNNDGTSKKSKGEPTLGRHFRSKSTDSVASERRILSVTSSATNLLAKIKLQQGPGDYVAYLRKIQKPELVEVGKLHKLRLLLRNETVAWIEEFIQLGGMKEIVGLLNRIMGVEWREEHEDALLHENLLCLKALSTTAKAMEHLHSVQADLFPKLLHMLFDPEKKGPSEFTTRNIVTSVLFAYIVSAAPAERVVRAKSVLSHLRDPEPEESARPVPFVMEMRQERPYRVWCKEVVSVTKEVFWIFLHNLNVVALQPETTKVPETGVARQVGDEQYAYMRRHFPQERPPVPAAPYVGGVEWDATNYLSSHLDLMNAILACTPTAEERNQLRSEFRISGWERCLGGSLRLCKEKFYGSVHTALRTWVAAAAEDDWDVKDVRFGPPVDARSPGKRNGGQRKPVEEPPKLDMPKLDFGLEQVQGPRDVWLS